MLNPAHSTQGVCLQAHTHACMLAAVHSGTGCAAQQPLQSSLPRVTSISRVLLMHTLKISAVSAASLRTALEVGLLCSAELSSQGFWSLSSQAGWLFVYIWVVTEFLLLQLLQTELYLNHSF